MSRRLYRTRLSLIYIMMSTILHFDVEECFTGRGESQSLLIRIELSFPAIAFSKATYIFGCEDFEAKPRMTLHIYFRRFCVREKFTACNIYAHFISAAFQRNTPHYAKFGVSNALPPRQCY